ncbi:MAG: ABC transporter permease, partial [Acidobacteriota bacterium]
MGLYKAYLVAERELLENLRTKTFWLGILLFPVILTLSIIVPVWLERTQDARTYAVIDDSGWLLEAVEQQATMPDLEKVIRSALAQLRDEDPTFDELPEALQQTARQMDFAVGATREQLGNASSPELAQVPAEKLEELRALDDEGLESVIVEGYARALAGLSGPEGEAIKQVMPPMVVAQMEQLRDDVRDWWQALPAEEASQYGEALSKSRYIRVDVSDAGTGEALLTELNRRVDEGELFAYFVIGADPVAGVGEDFRYVASNLADDDLRRWFERLSTRVVRERRLAQENISTETAAWIQAPVDFVERKVSKGGEESEASTQDRLRQWAPVAFVYLLFFAIMGNASMLMTNTVEEKSNRIVEVLLSSISPLQLMVGKIV